MALCVAVQGYVTSPSAKDRAEIIKLRNKDCEESEISCHNKDNLLIDRRGLNCPVRSFSLHLPIPGDSLYPWRSLQMPARCEAVDISESRSTALPTFFRLPRSS